MSEDFIRKWIETGSMQGATVAICRKGEVVYRNHFGSHTPDSVYSVFSLTKILTATAILQLQDQGKLHIDDPVAKHLPSFGQERLVDPNSHMSQEDANEPVTIKHCLNHTGGWVLPFGFVHPESLWTSLETKEQNRLLMGQSTHDIVNDYLARSPLLFKPGSRFHYGGGGFVAGVIIEAVSGKSLSEYFQENIIGPLGMKDTTFQATPEQQARMPKMNLHTEDLDHPVPKIMRPLLRLFTKTMKGDEQAVTEEKNITGEMGLKSTVDDFLRLNQMLLAGGSLDGVKILSPEAVELMCVNSLPDGAELLAPFSFQGAPKDTAPQFGISREPGTDGWKYRPLNSYPGHGHGLMVAVVEDAAKAGLHPRAQGTCWWQGLGSEYFAFNRNADLGVLVFAHEMMCVSRQPALADIINAAHEVFCD